MLARVVRPDGKEVSFAYDALGRRIRKSFAGTTTHFVWDGNMPLHEWTEEAEENVVTWLFEQDTFVPAAKLVANGDCFSIISDYLGTPMQAYDKEGNKVWEQELDIYGRQRKRPSSFIPFKYQGQYEDAETGLYYNRFRYYDPNAGSYISQDPIGLEGDTLNLYNYVVDNNDGIDPLGLYNPYGHKKNGQFKKKPGAKPKVKPSLHGNSRSSTKPAVLYAMYDGNGNFQKWGITDKVKNPKSGRYGNSLPDDWDVREMTRGKRTDMLDLERELSEKVPGHLNHESWAGSKKGETLSNKADAIYKKANH